VKHNARKYKRLTDMLTPMSKYYCSQMSIDVTYDSIQVLGGSGYMRDYAVERHARDARITTIYEGTTQLQIVAAVRGVCSGTAQKFLEELAGQEYDPELNDLTALLREGADVMKRCIEFVKEKGNEYMDLYGRPLVDIAMDLIIGYLFCGQGSTKVEMETAVSAQSRRDNGGTTSMGERKKRVARRFIMKNAPVIRHRGEIICSGDTSTFSQYGEFVGPVPASQ